MPLTEKEKMVLEFIESQLGETGVSPSYQEIKDRFGFASYNSVQNYLKQLTAKGYVQVASNQKRSIQVLHSSRSVQNQVQAKHPPRASLLQKYAEREEVLHLPLLGKVAAGRPLEHFSHDETVQVPPNLVRNPEKSFALKVSGSSMIEDGIFDGDVIIVQKQASVVNGEIVVATIENESTVKRIFTKGSDKLIELRPANSAMQSMWYPAEQVQIQGVVVGLIRKFN
jgi:repressor LexA